MNNSIIRYGFILILIGLVASLVAPMAKVPALAVSAHTISLIGGILLIALGAIWSRFTLSDKMKAVLKWSWIYANFGNWLGVSIASQTGATELLAINGGEATSGAAASALVGFLMLSISAAAIIAAVVAVIGLKDGD